MSRKPRRTFTQEFKIQAMDLADQLGSINSAAEKLGITPDNIRLWKRSIGLTPKKTQSPAAQAMQESEEIKRLRKQVSDLEKTNYILKKAAAFFSQDHLK